MKGHETYLSFWSYLSESHISHALFGAAYHMYGFAFFIEQIQFKILFVGGHDRESWRIVAKYGALDFFRSPCEGAGCVDHIVDF